jgi:hypothetical protein
MGVVRLAADPSRLDNMGWTLRVSEHRDEVALQ